MWLGKGRRKGSGSNRSAALLSTCSFQAAGGFKDAKPAPAPGVSVAELGRQCCHPVESRTEGWLQGHRGPGGVWAGPAVVLGWLPWWPVGDHLAWLWAGATQSRPGQLWDFKSQFTLPIYTGSCACNSWAGTVPMMCEITGCWSHWGELLSLLVLQCSHPTETPHLDRWHRNISFQGCP